LKFDRGRRAFVIAFAAAVADLLAGPVVAAAPGHRLTDAQRAALEGRTLEASPRLREDVARLVDDRFPRLVEGLADGRTFERLDDDLVVEGVRPGTSGTQASFLVVGRDGALFAALRSGLHGETVETFGDLARIGAAAHHRYLEFADLDE
jgi:hypothetical protein